MKHLNTLTLKEVFLCLLLLQSSIFTVIQISIFGIFSEFMILNAPYNWVLIVTLSILVEFFISLFLIVSIFVFVDSKISSYSAILWSIKYVFRNFFIVFWLGLILLIINVLSIFTIGIAWIWTLPIVFFYCRTIISSVRERNVNIQ